MQTAMKKLKQYNPQRRAPTTINQTNHKPHTLNKTQSHQQSPNYSNLVHLTYFPSPSPPLVTPGILIQSPFPAKSPHIIPSNCLAIALSSFFDLTVFGPVICMSRSVLYGPSNTLAILAGTTEIYLSI